MMAVMLKHDLCVSTEYKVGRNIPCASHGPAMAYMSHGRADAESLLEFMDSRHRPTSEILVIFLGQLTSAEVGDASPTFL